MAFRVISCTRCTYYFGEDMDKFYHYRKMGYTDEEAFTNLGDSYALPFGVCCRRSIKGHFTTGEDGIDYLNQNFGMKRFHMGKDTMPKWNGGGPLSTNSYISPELVNTDLVYPELDDIYEELASTTIRKNSMSSSNSSNNINTIYHQESSTSTSQGTQ